MTDSYPVFPFYIVIDVSMSMRDTLPAINEELPLLKQDVEQDPIVGDIARFGLITFSTDADMVLPLSDLLDVDTMPTLSPQGSTNYARAFELLNGAIPHDISWFKEKGAQIYRPVVFFITDGHPDAGNDWRPHHAALTDPSNRFRPNIVSFGFGNADDQILGEVATFKAYAANDGESPTQILQTIAKELTKSIMASSQAAAQGTAVLSMPEHIAGMHEIAIDLV